MDENTQEPTPINSEPIPAPITEQPIVAQEAQTVTPVAPIKKATPKFPAFEKLSNEVRSELKKALLNSTAKKTKEWFTQQYGVQYPDAANLSVFTYKNYKHFLKEREKDEQEVVQGLAVLASAQAKVVGNTTMNLADRRASLVSLAELIERLLNDRVKKVSESNFNDPMQDKVILEYVKGLQSLGNDYAKVAVQLSQQATVDNYDELAKFFQVVIAGVKNAYQITHKGNNNWDNFYRQLEENILPSMKRYRLVKDAILQ